MKLRFHHIVFRPILLLFLLIICFSLVISQQSMAENLHDVLNSLAKSMPKANAGGYIQPTEEELGDWTKALKYFRSNSIDSCKRVLARMNYELIQAKGSSTTDVYDVIREKSPNRKGWGMFIYNRNFKKRLYIDINHPIDDPNALSIGEQVFLSLQGEWMLIAGTSKRAVPNRTIADMGRATKSIFQRTHEVLCGITHVTLSLHSFDEQRFPYPINVTDVILGNGRTTDYQWGISQLSLAFRDTLRAAGFRCSLAMYDSGYSALAGGWNSQGIFSNDSIGFGHWIYVELSRSMRERLHTDPKFLSILDRALDITGKKVSHQVNRAFGLVSPRVLRVDSAHRLFFPTQDADAYRIVSFNASDNRNDTIDVRVGNWVNLVGGKKTLSTVTLFDTSKKSLRNQFSSLGRNAAPAVVAKIVKPLASVSSMTKFHDEQDSSLIDDGERDFVEPIQVHRIPLRPLLHQTYYAELSTNQSAYRWQGIVPEGFTPNPTLFEFKPQQQSSDEIRNLPNFLIPLINSSSNSYRQKFIGVQMTNLLVTEIARLITDYQVADNDIGLMAEQSEEGEYFLRIFPSAALPESEPKDAPPIMQP
jgi:hypothetical protein